jgi:hypothetical protein
VALPFLGVLSDSLNLLNAAGLSLKSGTAQIPRLTHLLTLSYL